MCVCVCVCVYVYCYVPLSCLDNMLEFVNLAVNVCSNMIGCFEVVPLSPTLTVI